MDLTNHNEFLQDSWGKMANSPRSIEIRTNFWYPQKKLEQAGFRPGRSTVDHIFTLSEVLRLRRARTVPNIQVLAKNRNMHQTKIYTESKNLHLQKFTPLGNDGRSSEMWPRVFLDMHCVAAQTPYASKPGDGSEKKKKKELVWYADKETSKMSSMHCSYVPVYERERREFVRKVADRTG